ncbi:serine/threonine protein phosphatase PrpC [Oxalobacteraceae bacterium GrIS 1.11]
MTCPICGDNSSSAGLKFCEGCGHAFMTPTAAAACACAPGAGAPDADGFCLHCGLRCGAAGVSNPHHWSEEIDARLAMVSDLGRRHAHNEDCGHVRSESGTALLVVADGVSSSFRPAGASALAIEQLKTLLPLHAHGAGVEQAMLAAVHAAHQAIKTLPGSDRPELDDPECTIVVALASAATVTVAWVGDSRAYLIKGQSERCLTVDDSWIEEVVADGTHTRAQANADPLAHCVTQVLGMRDDRIVPHVLSAPMAPEDILLLCSDGLWNYFQDQHSLAAMVDRLRQGHGARLGAREICQALVDAANAQGGQDNITVAILIGGAA